MSTRETTAPGVAIPAPVAAEKPAPPRLKLRDTWWRHAVGVVAVVISLFPVVFIISASFNRDNSVGGTTVLPTHFTLDNYSGILHNHVHDVSHPGYVDAPFLRWYLNSLVVAAVAGVLTVILGALAAYAFSRFRFRGRRLGMLALLLIQMFPQLLLVVAIYLIVLNVGGLGGPFQAMGLNTLTALIIVYLGGALGVNTWLMKGFFDTIPAELDESARVDGATPAQIFWGVVLPLAAPVLAVVGLLSFVFTFNEFVVASAILQTSAHQTLPLGMRGFIDQQYGQRWGPFAAGALLAAVPATILFMGLQKWIVSGLTAGSVKG
jgi:arabinogalactan oligomer/maltooligosaccharide transport system permease protein